MRIEDANVFMLNVFIVPAQCHIRRGLLLRPTCSPFIAILQFDITGEKGGQEERMW